MPYSNFTLAEAQETFQLETFRAVGIFSGVAPVEPSVSARY